MARDSVGAMFRYQNNDNYYRFSWNSRNNVRRLEKCQNGVFTVLAEDIKGYVTGQTYAVEVIVKDTMLEVVVDSALVFTARDSSFSEGTIALYSSSNQGSSFDDVLVEDLVTGAILLLQSSIEVSEGTWIRRLNLKKGRFKPALARQLMFPLRL